jgi:dolichyl-phosphate beta-glucosyltransferase
MQIEDDAAVANGSSAPSPDGPGESITLSVIIPAFNEVNRLESGFERLQHAVDIGAVDPKRTEFLVVDDGSTDGTTEQALVVFSSLPHVRVVTLDRHAGKGAAVRAGIKESRGNNVVFADADMAIDPVQIPTLVAKLTSADIAVGARTLPGSEVDHFSTRRNLEGRIFNSLVNALTGIRLGDTQCGFKAFRTPVARVLFHFSVIDGFAFDVEVLRSARRLKLTIGEIPVRWSNVRGSRIRPLSDPISMVNDVLRCRFGQRTGPGMPAVSLDGTPVQPLADLVLRALGESTPVICSDQGILVLFPLSGPQEVQDACERLSREVGPGSMRRHVLTREDLEAQAPLSWVSSSGCGVARSSTTGI